jgi:dienelactone hydrolase
LNLKAPYAVILATHGHEPDLQTRFSANTQYRCAALARMGAVVFALDMFGYGDSIQEVGAAVHEHPFSMTIQLWDNMRALDFLLLLPGADTKRVAVTGESGGGTQSFILTALDSRVKLSVPVVMVSSYFFGGCPCESGLSIHRSKDHFANNAMIAALAAPRPMLVVSDGADWTKDTPAIEYPFLKKIYDYYDAVTNVANVHLPNEGHDYGPSKREAMYRFVSEKFHLNLAPIQDSNGKIDESHIIIEEPESLHVFNKNFPLPQNTLRSATAVESALEKLQDGGE